MKKLIQSFLFVAVSILLVWILKQAFPKNSGALNFFLVFLFLDAFLWVETNGRIRTFRTWCRVTLTILYWLPMLLVVAGVIYGFFDSFYAWPRFVKTYLTSFILIAYISKAFPIIFMLLKLLYQGILLLLSRVSTQTRSWIRKTRIFYIMGWAIGLSVFIIMMAGMVFWEHDFRVRTTQVTLEEMPCGFDGLTIIQISDLHLGSWNRASELEELVEKINALNADLVFYTGDICNYTTAEVWPFQEILAKINARYGIYAVLGNHDYGDYMTWSYDYDKEKNMRELERFYREMGWHLLRNENHILIMGEDSLAIIGVENWGATSRFQRLANLPEALQGCEEISTKLLLSHDPSYWDSIVSKQYPGIGLTFSGHTHGGQIGIEFRNFKWSIVQYLYSEWAGLYQQAHHDKPSQYLYVNRGAGTIGYAGRIGVLPEITLIRLQCGRNENDHME